MKFYKCLAVLFVTFLTFGVVHSEDPKTEVPVVPVESSPALDAMTIAEMNKDAIVTIETTIDYGDLGMIVMGGSGFFVSDKGEVMTNAHVVSDPFEEQEFGRRSWIWSKDEKEWRCRVISNTVRVEEKMGMFGPPPKPVGFEYWIILNNRKYRAELLANNKYKDVALLKALEINPKDYHIAKLGNADKLKVGENVYAFGAPFGLSKSFTSGRVSALHRHINLLYVEDYIQTDAPINPGNSGSPLLNSVGEVVGLNDAGIRGADGMGFAISINFANLEKLRVSGIVKIGYLGSEVLLDNFPRTGAAGSPNFKDVLEFNRLTGVDDLQSLIMMANSTYPRLDDSENRAVVVSVDRRSPAEASKLKRGDIVLSFNGVDVKNGWEVRLQMLEIAPDKEFEVKVLRFEKGSFTTVVLKIKLAKEKPKPE